MDIDQAKENGVEIISIKDIPGDAHYRTLLMNAVRALEPGMAIKFPCTYPHSKTKLGYIACNGRSSMYTAGRRAGYKLHTRCVDKVIYVWRDA
mgnify:CR=1 FL=1